MITRRSHFAPSDGFLLALALVALAVYAVLMPRQHPDAAADYRQRQQALEAAQAFFREAGFAAPPAATMEASLRRNNPLLDTLQRVGGRPEVVRLLKTEAGRRLGVYHWRVKVLLPAAEAYATFQVTLDGQVFAYEVEKPAAFDEVPLRGGEAGLAAAPLDTLARGEGMEKAFAERVLAHSALAGQGLRVDSTSGPPGPRVAHLGGGRIAGRRVAARMVFDADGRLLEMAPSFAAASEDEGAPAWAMGLALALYVLGIVGVLIAFFKRLSDRLVDTRAALRDALWGALIGIVWISMSSSRAILEQAPSALVAYGIILVNTTIVGLGVAFLVFVSSGVSESVARPVWAGRLVSLSLIRNGFWYDGRVGAALVRGMAGAVVAAGLMTAALAALPGLRLKLGASASGVLSTELTVSVAPWVMAFYALLAVLQTYVVLLAFGGALYRRLGGWAFVVAGLVLVPMQLVVPSPQSLGVLAVNALPVAVAVALFHRHDALTALVCLAIYGTFFDMASLWMVPGSPGMTSFFALYGVLALLFVIGGGVMLRGRTVREDSSLVPAYIRERQHEARMERELEIAHTVQMSFLPRTMPQVVGLDVAALCLPAQEVGGDYYDVIRLDDHRLALVIGDVSGKGIQAAFFMTLVKGVIRTLAHEDLAPDEVLRRVNRVFFESAPRGTFISMIYGIVDTRARAFTFARAGHNPVILHRAPSQQADMVQPPGLGIGLDPGPRFDRALKAQTLDLTVGDTLVLYTDGFSEAMNLDRMLYTDETLAHQASQSHGPTARHTLDALTRGVNVFMNGASQHDDMTMIVLRVTAAAPPSSDPSA